ncbi:hypothetical protein [Lachnospira multipara]|uniref:hypothetical protein n=1 Tax=Lachnospira multipara TaxID=28051 RepID=UPI0018CC7783|nr:hypothetical protein [Lachnospira multipara]
MILLIFLGLRDYGVGFINLTDFTSQYTGEWNPSEGHWFGLDFTYKNITYRLNTGNMYTNEEDFLFGLYIKTEDNDIETNQGYKLLFSCNSMEDLLNSTAIDNTCFRDIIINKDVELLGQD